MQVTEKLARYIICLQRVADAEIGMEEGDYEIRRQLEEAFPVLREEREKSEFNMWLWSEKVEQDQRVKNSRAVIKGMPEMPPVSTWAREAWHKKQTGLAYQLDDVKQTVEVELIKADAAGEIDLKAEWDACRRIKQNGKAK